MGASNFYSAQSEKYVLVNSPHNVFYCIIAAILTFWIIVLISTISKYPAAAEAELLEKFLRKEKDYKNQYF